MTNGFFARAISLGVVLSAFTSSHSAQAWPASAYKIKVGRFESRAVWAASGNAANKRPTVILIPGSGAHGPEEVMPASLTADGKDHAILGEFAAPLFEGGANILSLGKPGVNAFAGKFDYAQWFYNSPLYHNLKWNDLIDNVDEAVEFALAQPSTDPSRIYLLGHSEGTQVAADYAMMFPQKIRGLLLLGYADDSLGEILDWQLFRRTSEMLLKADIDLNRDGAVSATEAPKLWKMTLNTEYFRELIECYWDGARTEMRIDEMNQRARNCKPLQETQAQYSSSPLYSNGVFSRVPLHEALSKYSGDIHVFTGELDVQTQPSQALALKQACQRTQKKNCSVTLVPGVGHNFSAPKGHRLIHPTAGPVSPSFQNTLRELAHKF